MKLIIKFNVLFVSFLINTLLCGAQTYLSVKDKNGAFTQYNIHNLQTIAFLSGNIVFKNSGVILNSIPISSISNISFLNNFTTSVKGKSMVNSERFLPFPNPANDILNFTYHSEFENEIDLIVLTLDGKTIIQKNIRTIIGENNISLPIANLKLGVYLIRLKKGEEILISKFIKSK